MILIHTHIGWDTNIAHLHARYSTHLHASYVHMHLHAYVTKDFVKSCLEMAR